LTTALARQFTEKRLEDGAVPATVNRSLACLRRMLRLAYEDAKIVAVPKIRLMKEPSARKEFLERTKFEELLEAMPDHLHPLVATLYWCGLRKGEALQVDCSQVDPDVRTIMLHDEQRGSTRHSSLPCRR
jgi:integrase